MNDPAARSLPLSAVQEGHGARLDGAALAHRAHLFGRLGLDVDLVRREPSACAMRARMAGMCGASLGACAITVLSTLPISPAGGAHPARRFGQQQRRSRRRETAHRCPGKCRPMSPSAAAPSSASVMACSSASASEWPSRPERVRDLDAAEHQLAAGHQRVHVPAFADANARQRSCGTTPQHRLGQREVFRVGHLEVLRAAGARAAAPARAPRSRWPRRSPRRPRAPARRAAGRCGTSAASAPATCRRAAACAATRPSGAAALSVSATRWASRPPTASCSQAAISASICVGVTRQRAASCTSTQSCGPAPRSRSACSPLRTLAARVAPPTCSRCSPSPGKSRQCRRGVTVVLRHHQGDAGKAAGQRAEGVQRVPHHRPAGDALVLLGPRCRRRGWPVPAQGISDDTAVRRGMAWAALTACGGHSRIGPSHTPRRPARGVLYFSGPAWTCPPLPPASASRCPARPAPADALLLARAGRACAAGSGRASAVVHRRRQRRQRLLDETGLLRARSCAAPCSRTGRPCPTTASRRTRT